MYKSEGESSLGGFLVYINGVRIPALSASVSVQIDTPASASVSVPAHSILYGLGDEDFLDAAIFYLDNYYYDSPTWCLLFEGRIIGQGYSNDSIGESMYFTLESNMNSLSDLYLNFMPKGNGKTTSSSSYPNQINIKGKSSKSFLSESLSGRKLARPFDLIDNIFYSVLGSTTAGVDSRLAKLASKSVDSLVEKKLQALGSKFDKRARDFMGRRPSNMDIETYEANVNFIASEMRRDWVIENKGDPELSTLDHEIERLLKRELKASAQKGSPTVITGFFARYFRRIRSRNHWACSPYLEGNPNTENPIKALIGGGVFPVFRSTKSSRYAKSMAKQSGAKYGPQGSALSLVKNIYGLYFYKISEVLAPPIYTADKYGLPHDRFYSGAYPVSSNDYKNEDYYNSWSSKLTEKKNRLCIASYLTNPSMTFAVPPACNVIFPSTRLSFNVNNNYKSKPTRLYYNKKSPYGRLDFSVNSSSYATDSSRVTFPSIIAGAAQKAAGKATEEIDLLIFPEEYYRGPHPVQGQMHPTYMDIKKYASAARFGTVDRGDPQVAVPSIEGMSPEEAISALESVDKSSKKKISSYGLYYMLARQDFLKRKFGAVSGDASLVFNPYLVCGFPCAMLSGDKSGLHFYGEIASITHNLSPTSSSTSVQISTLRSLDSIIQGISADGFDLDSYPQEPVQEIRDLLQVYESANEYYSQVLYKEEIGQVSSKDYANIQEYNSLLEEIAQAEERIKEIESNLSFGDNFEIEARKMLGPKDADTDLSTYLDEVELLANELKRNWILNNNLDLLNSISSLEAKRSTLESSLSKLPNEIDYSTIKSPQRNLPTAFDFKSFLGWDNGSGRDPDFIVINKFDEERRSGQEDRITSAGYRRAKLVPLPETKKYFESTSSALRLSSRPVCTLEQYIDFYSCVDVDKLISDSEGRGRGCRLGEKLDDFSGAVYYDVIRQYIGGPGMEPGTTIEGKSKSLVARLEEVSRNLSYNLSEEQKESIRYKIEEIPEGLELTGIGPRGPKTFAKLSTNQTLTHSDLPDSRKDWQRLLLDYLTIIEGIAPQIAEG